MSFPFGKSLFAKANAPFRKETDTGGRRIIGLVPGTHEPIFAPKAHSWLLSANGGGKTTCGAAVWLMSLLASQTRPAILVMDHKNGEMVRQFGPMLRDMGVPMAVIDDTQLLPPDFPGRVSLNPIAAVVETYRTAPEELIFATEVMTHALIEEPKEGDERNKYFRDWPRRLIEFATLVLLKRNPALATPGGIWALLSDPEMMRKFAVIEAEEGDGMIKTLARNLLGMVEH